MPPRDAHRVSRSSATSQSRTQTHEVMKHSPTKKHSASKKNSRYSYEWGGPLGALGMVALLPLTVVSLNMLCSESSCSLNNLKTLHTAMASLLQNGVEQIPEALVVELMWLALHAVFYLLPIGKQVKGVELPNGKCLTYNINALHAFLLTHVGLAVLHFTGQVRLEWIADMFVPLMLAAIIISSAMSVALYVASFRSKCVMLSAGGSTGNPVYDFWVGRELNPRMGLLDWKFMCELRPGLIGWSILNWSFVAKAVENGTVSPNVVGVALLESFYVLDGLYYEEANLSMMDIVHDGFGFMLCFGDLAWVPFTYTLKTRFLAYNPVHVSPVVVGVSCLLTLVGYIIFRGSNNQKSQFRRNPKDEQNAGLRVLKTSSGKSLIISGYWGICRHPNYAGDWLMTLSWSLLTGFTSVVPYFQPLYFAALLIHRQLRDEEQMLGKYGAVDLKKFHNAVPYRLIPYVY